jgi:predicted AlkP superfamily pyrophosphatase or phosphodiesterase
MSSRRFLAVLFLVIIVVVVALPARRVRAGEAPAAAAAASDNAVVMISVDGLASFYFDDPKAEMPTLRKLAAEGAHAQRGMIASTPSVTWPNHTTLVTGVPPALHGVTGNNFFDRAAGKRVTLIWDPIFDKDQIVKVATIYDVAHDAGMITAAIRWPASRNARTLDWATPDMKDHALLEKSTTPALITRAKAAGCWLDDIADLTDLAKVDPRLVSMFTLILRENHPRLALLHIADTDHTQHAKGPRSAEAYAAIKTADGQVAAVWEELQRNYAGKATLIVVSDHGFSPITRQILPNVILRQAGLIKTSVTTVTGGAVQLVPQGGCAMLYITGRRTDEERAEIVSKIRRAFENVAGVAKVVDPAHLKDYGVADPKDDPHAPDMLLFAEMGHSFGDTAAGDIPFQEKPERSGTHGHDPNLPDLHATFIAAGAGVTPGTKLGEISNTQVAPTIATLLHLELPKATGKPLNLTP